MCRNDDPRHTCRVIKIEHGSEVTVKWDGTAWFSVERLADIERTTAKPSRDNAATREGLSPSGAEMPR